MSEEKEYEVAVPTKFSMIPEWLLDVRDGTGQPLSPRAYMVYGTLAKFANSDTRETFVSHSKIAEKIGCSRGTVVKSIRELEDIGAIKVEPRYINGEQTSNLYTLVWDAPQSFIASKSTFLAETEDTVQDEGFDISYAQIKTKKNIILKPLWAPLVEVCGYKPDTKSMFGAWNSAIKELEELGATPEDIFNKAAAYKKRFKDAEMTPKALAKWWNALETTAPGSTKFSLTKLEEMKRKALAEE